MNVNTKIEFKTSRNVIQKQLNTKLNILEAGNGVKNYY